jgi:hypothetical protein
MRDGFAGYRPLARLLLPGILLAAVLLAHAWVLGPGNGFLFDDFLHLTTVKFKTAASLFHVLPQMRYNDRPVGALAVKMMFQLFGLDFGRYHAVLLLLHLFNTWLLYRLAVKLTAQVSGDGDRFAYLPFLAAGIFGLWPRSTFCVQWLAGIFDLLGATFTLLVFNLYVNYRTSSQYRVFNALLAVLLYYAGLRVKEMLIVIPVLLLGYDIFCRIHGPEDGWGALKKYRPSLLAATLLGLMAAYYLYFIRLNTGAALVNTASSPYYYSLHPAVIGTNLLRYFAIYFDYTNFAYGFISFSAPAIAGLIFLAAFLLAGIVQAARGGRPVLLALLFALVISLAPVLPLKNMQHMLYWYIPAIFLSLILSVAFNALVERLTRSAYLRMAANVGALALVLALNWSAPVVAFRRDWSSQTLRNQTTLADLKKLQGIAQGTVFYVQGATDVLNAFYYGPGAVNQLVFNDETIRTVLNPKQVTRTGPYVVLNYDVPSGHIERAE